MATPVTVIQNVTANPVALPHPYKGVVPGGGQIPVIGSVDEVISNLGGVRTVVTTFDIYPGLESELSLALSNMAAGSVVLGAPPGIGVTPGSTIPSALELFEMTPNGSDFVAFRAPANIPANVIWTLPATDGAPSDVLTTNGAGILSWTVGGGGGGGSGVAVDSASLYSCPATVAVRDVVYLSAADAVDKADADDPAKFPAIGFVVTKPSATTCTVRYAGELGGFSGLTLGSTYYSATTPGGIARVGDGDFPTALGSVVQELGFARNATTLAVVIDRDFTIL